MGSCCLAAVFKEPSRSPSSSGSWPDFTHLPTLWLSGLLGSVALFQELCDLLLPRRTDGRHGAEEIDHLPSVGAFFAIPLPWGGGCLCVIHQLGGTTFVIYLPGGSSFAIHIKPPESVFCRPKLHITRAQAYYLSLDKL